jgi:DNA-binding MarR family transcriptional regulator
MPESEKSACREATIARSWRSGFTSRRDALTTGPSPNSPLEDKDYRTLAAVRAELRGFAHFTEQVVKNAGLTPQQHQVLVALRATDEGEMPVGELAEALFLRPHSVSGLADRLEALGMVERVQRANDRRSIGLRLTGKARSLMSSLSRTHRDELRRIRPLLISLLSQLD